MTQAQVTPQGYVLGACRGAAISSLTTCSVDDGSARLTKPK
jgi:hypothetical protein